ncbi:MAG: hypothetical protein GOV01_03095 [Candidatus Altiarchaeota archaeon]|nr:hypothetical protein [Candidatus Altiarchaeota archaeon]
MIFLKIGGSVITDKSKPFTVNWTGINTAVKGVSEIEEAMVVGHGGGSFGHIIANEYKGMQAGFFKIREAMAKLNGLFVASLISKGVDAVGFPPSSFLLAKGGKVTKIFSDQLMEASKNYVPVIHGDAILDSEDGYRVFSVERIFYELAGKLKPRKVFLATDGPIMMGEERVEEIADWNFRDILKGVSESEAIDVTGGMRGKIMEAAKISAKHKIECYIFDGSIPDAIRRAWKYGEGTRIRVTRIPKNL